MARPTHTYLILYHKEDFFARVFYKKVERMFGVFGVIFGHFCNFSYSLAQLRALGESIGAISLSFHKEMAKERELRGEPLSSPERATKS